MIPLQRPALGPEAQAAVERVLASGWLGRGPLSEAFERELAEVTRARHVLAVSTGTAALHLALACLDLRPGDEVLLPSLTFAASAQAVLMAGATPVFCEVRDDTLNLDPDDVVRRLTARSRVVMPVHFGGLPCDMDALLPLARQARLIVVEDAAHAFGSSYRGRPIGSVGDLTAFSFDPIKNVTCGEGGAVATSSDEWAAAIRLMRNLGIDGDGWSRVGGKGGEDSRNPGYSIETAGFRYHLPDLNAAIGLSQLPRLQELGDRKRAIVTRYDRAFEGRDDLTLVRHDLGDTFPFFYVLRVRSDRRDAFRAHLAACGVSTGIHYVPNHLQPLFAAPAPVSLPRTERLFQEIVTLPLYGEMEDTAVDRVIEAVDSFGAR